MRALLVGAGVVIIALTGADIALTVLHPARRGPVTHRANRLVWQAVKAGSQWTGWATLRTFAGPLAALGTLGTWIVGLAIGFSLVYLPFLDAFRYGSLVRPGATGLAEALYISTVALTTLGYGDIVAGTDALRLVRVVEAAAGAATITAAISYVLSVYPLVTQVRATALWLGDLTGGNPLPAATSLAADDGAQDLARLHRSLIRIHQNLRRFPVLYYFQPSREQESILFLLRTSTLLCLVVRWGTPAGPSLRASRYAIALEAALRRLLADYASQYLRPRRGDREAGSEEVPDGFCDLLRYADDHLADLAADQGYRYQPLLAGGPGG